MVREDQCGSCVEQKHDFYIKYWLKCEVLNEFCSPEELLLSVLWVILVLAWRELVLGLELSPHSCRVS